MGLDSATLARIRLLYPDVAVSYIRVCNDVERITGLRIRCQEGRRTFETQAEYYAQGRTTLGPEASPARPMGRTITNAKPGESLHHYGVAIDSCWVGLDPYLQMLAPAKAGFLWKEYGRIAKAHGFEWGGDFRTIVDRPHIQKRYGFSAQEIRELHVAGGIEAVWAAIDRARGVPQGTDWLGPQMNTRLIDLAFPKGAT